MERRVIVYPWVLRWVFKLGTILFCTVFREKASFIVHYRAIAIPDTLYFMENENKIDKRISRFVVPFSSALNKSGSALYIAASCVFICQLEKIETDFAQVLVIM